MTDLITEARELCKYSEKIVNQLHTERLDYELEYMPLIETIQVTSELCDALEKAQFDAEWNKRLYETACADRDFIEAERRWIPVTERLPTERGYYLAVVKRTAPDELGGNNTRVKIMRWLGEDWRYPVHIPEWINDAITEAVTHWMRLPAPPEKEGEEP